MTVAEHDGAGASTSDSELVARVRAGDDRAFEELYRRYNAAIVAFARGRIRDAAAAEDVAQEAFTSALRRLRQTDAQIAFRAWIYEIARNASIDFHRRRGRVSEVSIDAGAPMAAADSARLVGPITPDACVLGRERFEHLRGALEELSETHNRVIVLRELEGLSYNEIGERMALSPSAVESTLFRARRKLEHEYAEVDSGRRCRVVDAAIARLAGGEGSQRDLWRLSRHARRCAGCRRRAHSQGVDPVQGRGAWTAALLPLPALLRGRGGGGGGSASFASAMPTLEFPAAVTGKLAVLATALLVGGGATLGESGSPAPDRGDDAAQGSGERRDGAAEAPAGGGSGATPVAGERAPGAGQAPGEADAQGRGGSRSRGPEPGAAGATPLRGEAARPRAAPPATPAPQLPSAPAAPEAPAVGLPELAAVPAPEIGKLALPPAAVPGLGAGEPTLDDPPGLPPAPLVTPGATGTAPGGVPTLPSLGEQ
ncbi:MAG: sigma-70 family RNA polymerase sigma factor [Thermoleophilaceae bacterium]